MGHHLWKAQGTGKRQISGARKTRVIFGRRSSTEMGASPANNMEWMMDLAMRIYKDKGKTKGEYQNTSRIHEP
ncbi:hypothetical protein EYC84_003009 [Monilinia fructicola]|uniref:Uncharacterized protein n=1 Tax=Monilinia fructicola TaxID=38448 RepID=A0A5M9JUN3_MONFR|nr:hypothetical protein EYC84_003009 [Monilinia fructicola]